MIGFVLVTHTHIGHQMVLAIEQILKEKTGLIGVNFDPEISIEKNEERIQEAVDKFKDREGVIILGQGRALGTASFIGGKLTRLAPTPPDPFVQIPLDDMDVLDQLAAALRAATSGRAAGGAGG